MPRFTVLRRVDAYADYTTVVEANDAKEAALLARENADDYEWTEDGVVTFDARGYVTLNSRGVEIEATRTGYFG